MNPADEIRAFISDVFFVDEFTDEQSFLRSGVIDSTGMLELVEFIESRFEIEFDDDELVPENLDSVVNIVNFVARKSSMPRTG